MRRGAAVAFILFASALANGCSSCRGEKDDKRNQPTQPQLPPLAAPSPVVALAIPGGYAEATVTLPAGVIKPAPIVVAVLGIGDTPEEQCAVWRELVGRRAFVLCPRGLPHYVVPGENDEDDDKPGEQPTPQPDAKPVQVGFYMPDVVRLDKEITAGIAALKAKYPQYVNDKEVLYAGFSRGAFLGPQLAAKNPARFSKLILIEGGQSGWSDDAANAFAKGGGKRILFACGQQQCVDEALTAAGTLSRRKVDTKTVFGQGEGHGYKKQVKDELKKHFEWVIEGDPDWK